MTKLVKQKIKKNLTKRIGIEVVIIKQLCKQEVIGMRLHQFKVSGSNNIYLICNSYFNVKPEVEIGIAN